MPLADDFQRIVDSLPSDWTDLQFDLRIFDEDRYIEAATMLVQVNAQGHSKHDWHWRILVAHEFGHAAAPETVRGRSPCSTRWASRGSWLCARLARDASR